MKAFFSNVWVKRFVSIIPVFYTIAVGYLCYYSIFYDIHIQDRQSLCVIVSAISLIALILMLYTRNQLLTKISSFLILAAMLPVVVFWMDEKHLYVPIVIAGVIILLFSGASEGKKTMLGTIILLSYIFGALGFYLFNSFFVTHAKKEILKSGVSPSGRYRYELINTEDTSGGSTSIVIEPNYADVSYPYVTLTLKDVERVCYQVRPMLEEEVKLDWSTGTREEITKELNGISDDIRINLTDAEFEAYNIDIDRRLEISGINLYKLIEIGKSASDVDPLKLDDLSESQLAVFDIGKDVSGKYYVLEPTSEFYTEIGRMEGDRIFLSELDSKGYEAFSEMHLDEFGYTLYDLGKDNTIALSELSDSQLAELGVSESGDVLKFNDKICFRYYVAELEDYYNTEKKSISFDLFG
ncbi:MAG: hypothetical protein IJN43_03630 [Ruminococcus sp.]|nr:hypothetical protein [Ruminococcus sp.]